LLAKGKAGKYTEYSEATGITKTHGQSTTSSFEISVDAAGTGQEVDDDPFSSLVVGRLTLAIREFATERLWLVYHRPRNLALALVGELGELAELVQWNGDQEESLSDEQLDKLSQELADVAIYLLRLADVCGRDILLESKVTSRENTL
jgi:NTP pyrophosphatase (non-canonical NTP hydrolase)